MVKEKKNKSEWKPKRISLIQAMQKRTSFGNIKTTQLNFPRFGRTARHIFFAPNQEKKRGRMPGYVPPSIKHICKGQQGMFFSRQNIKVIAVTQPLNFVHATERFGREHIISRQISKCTSG